MLPARVLLSSLSRRSLLVLCIAPPLTSRYPLSLHDALPISRHGVTGVFLEAPFLGTHAIAFPGARWLPEHFSCRDALPFLTGKDVVCILAASDHIIDNGSVEEALRSLSPGRCKVHKVDRDHCMCVCCPRVYYSPHSHVGLCLSCVSRRL